LSGDRSSNKNQKLQRRPEHQVHSKPFALQILHRLSTGLVGPTITFQLNAILPSLPLFCVFCHGSGFFRSSEQNDSATKAAGVKIHRSGNWGKRGRQLFFENNEIILGSFIYLTNSTKASSNCLHWQ